MSVPKKLIEVAMPIKEISAESVRDKSIRSGHISTLHLWWARRPLPVCRAVVFASLVPDPLDENCPPAFKEAVRVILGKENNPGDPYKPYDDIPYTAAVDKMEDNYRNRLMMFIGKYSDEYAKNEKKGLATPTNKQISSDGLIKWENKNNEEVINKARQLIWIAHNAKIGGSFNELLSDFEKHYKAIKDAEVNLYSIQDRHKLTVSVKQKEEQLQQAIDSFLNKMPKVFDPFAGGGAIPLEAARLGCWTYGNDINPVAHIIQKASIEYPQKYGKPIVFSKAEFISLYTEELWKQQPHQNKIVKNGEVVAVKIENRLAFDVAFFGNKILKSTEQQLLSFYPLNKRKEKVLVYYWSRIGHCSNPTCKAEVPLLKQFYLSKRRGSSQSDWEYLSPTITNKAISFTIKKGFCDLEGWINNHSLKCPCCGNITSKSELKRQANNNELKEKLIAVLDLENNKQKFRIPYEFEISVIDKLPNVEIPLEEIVKGDSRNLSITLWGIDKWGKMLSKRQLLLITELIKINKEILDNNVLKLDIDYFKALKVYIALLIDRIALRNTRHNTWHVHQNTVETIMGRQTLSMILDYPEMHPFSNFTSSSYNLLSQLLEYIENESSTFNYVFCQNASSGDINQFKFKYLDAAVTDPPYYDAIAYADLSDFFYVWLKRNLSDVFPLNFAMPLTPKSEECTALKHHHNNDKDAAKSHFENKLTKIFKAIEHQTNGIVSIMFAHQSTEAWTTLCNSILKSQMNITGSWAIDTEMTAGLKDGKSFLSSSVTVSCIPSIKKGYGDYKEVKKAIEQTVSREVSELYRLGFRGPDLLTACFGQAVSEFGKYEKVEKADGSEVLVADLLKMARESAFNALLKGFEGDDFTKFYIGWLQLYGFAESDFDDAAKLSRVGLSINVADLFTEHILIKNGNKQSLGSFEDRLSTNKNLGSKPNSLLIDQVHRAMALYKGTNRTALLQYIEKVASSPDNTFWRVVTSLCEVLPAGSEDHKQGIGLLTNKDSLIRESKTIQVATTEQTKLFE